MSIGLFGLFGTGYPASYVVGCSVRVSLALIALGVSVYLFAAPVLGLCFAVLGGLLLAC